MEMLVTIILISIPMVIVSWALPRKYQLPSISIFTAIFLAYYSPISLIILFTTSYIGYYVLKHLKLYLAVSIAIVLSVTILLIFKLNGEVFNIYESRLIPLGLSYYSFRQVHYAIEIYKNKIHKHTLSDYMNYMFFMPTLVIGPINRFQQFYKDSQRRRWDSFLFATGLERILYGLVKVYFLGNFLLSNKLNMYALQVSETNIWLGSYLQLIKFSANAYFQFAGYSDIAIGISLLLGFKIVENFNWPFVAQNIADFWRRWHISLSDWCRDYVFLPFLSITRNAKIATIISMVILGVWHEISLNYLIWGAMHAIAINIWHRYNKSLFQQKLSKYPNLQKITGIFITLHFVMLSFVIIKENSIANALEAYKILLFIK